MSRRWPRGAGIRADLQFSVGARLDDNEVSELDHFLSARWGLITRRGQRLLHGQHRSAARPIGHGPGQPGRPHPVDGASIAGSRSATFADLDLSAQRFTGDLQAADFTRAKLDQAVFAGADLRGGRFVGSSLRRARFEPTLTSYLRLDGSDFAGADLTGAVIVVNAGGFGPAGAGALGRALSLDRVSVVSATEPSGLPSGAWFDPAMAQPRWAAPAQRARRMDEVPLSCPNVPCLRPPGQCRAHPVRDD